ncbi:hypothetical protein [Micromonospora sp. NPDC005174]|uniref:hypothetical protein n=1 Tax=Micromonospora sp. NPDC005174 TaxID=3157018 RepID=UPI00339FE961
MTTVEDEIRRDREAAEAEMHNLIIKRLHDGDCGCKSEVHPPEQWDYYGRLADAVQVLFEADRDWGVRLHNPDSKSGAVWECDDREGAFDTVQNLSGNPPVVRRLSARLLFQEWAEVQR